MPSPKPNPVIEPPALARLAHRGTEVTLTELREALGLSVEDVAEAMGADSPAWAGRIEEHGYEAGTGRVQAYLKALGFKGHLFMDGTGRIRAVRGNAAFTIR